LNPILQKTASAKTMLLQYIP